MQLVSTKLVQNGIFSILVIGVLLGSAMIAPLNMLPEADALKSKGTPSAAYGSSTKDKVCGDRLCSEIPKEPNNSIEEENGDSNDGEPQMPPVHQMCTLEYMPVCGIDEKTYGNMCMLDAADVPLDHVGECNTNDKREHIASPVSDETLKFTQESVEIDSEKGYFVTEIADGLYWVMDGTYQAMFLTTGQGTIVVDAPASMGEKYLQAIAEVTDEPVTHFIYSHTHTDHVGAAGMFSDASVIIAQQQAADHLAMKNDPNRPVPTVSFGDTYTLDVGNQTLELYYIGNYHSKGDIIVYAPSQKVAMIVDYFHPGGAPFKNFGITQDMGAHIATSDVLLEMFDDDVIYVSGHEKILGTKQHITEYKQFTNDVLNNAYAAFGKVNFEEIALQQGPDADTYEMFDAYIDALAASCTQDTIEQWDGKLHGLETFMEDNCTTMSIYAMLD